MTVETKDFRTATGGPALRPVRVKSVKDLGPQEKRQGLFRVTAAQVVIVVVFLVCWQYLPTVGWISDHITILNSFYISSPSAIFKTLAYLLTGTHGVPLLWPYLRTTVEAAVIGAAIGMLLGGTAGLIFSNSKTLSKIARPFIVLLNSIPRVALIPIFVLLAGPTVRGSTTSAAFTVFFLTFFNAFEGGNSVNESMLENATLLGARPIAIMRYVRLPMVMAWTFAAIPNAISFGIVVAVTAELLAGIPGMGFILLESTTNVESALTFAIVIALSVVGLVLYSLASLLRKRLLHWQGR